MYAGLARQSSLREARSARRVTVSSAKTSTSAKRALGSPARLTRTRPADALPAAVVATAAALAAG